MAVLTAPQSRPSSKKSSSRPEKLYAFLGLLGLLLLFYPELFFARHASLAGDHWEQHFPWAALLSQSVKHLSLPFWTPLIHCGYPIAAEGQIGIFYLPNLMLSFLLPLRWAYAYMNVAHFLFSGFATYLYAREMKLKPLSAFVAGFFFCFGTAYGGAFYNITSLKTIAWFPFALLLLEKYLRGRGVIHLLWLSISLGFSLLAGYLQVALFMLVIFTLYAGLRIFIFPPAEGSDPVFQTAGYAVAVAGAFLIASPQLLLTFPLAFFSNRVNLSEEYAYVGSLSPMALLTFIFPTFQGFLRGNCLYLGLFAIYLAVHAFVSKEERKTPVFRLWVAMAVLSLLLALGEWSPLYVALVKLTRFYSFRVPAKFLVFICFAVSMLAAIGFEAMQKSFADKNGRALKRPAEIYAAIIGSATLCYATLYGLLAYGRPFAVKGGQWLISHFIHGRMGHPYSLEQYYEKLNVSLESIYLRLSFDNPWNRWIFILIAIHMILVFALAYRKVPAKGTGYLLVLMFVAVIDLYAFSFADIRRDFDSYGNVLRSNPLIERLKTIQKEGKLGRLYGFRAEGESLPLVPSANMLYGFEDIGGYSPLVLGRYFETVGLFGNVNDSNRAFSPTPEFVLTRLKLLVAIGVSHILSTRGLNDDRLKLLAEDSESFLYENQGSFSRAHFLTRIEAFPDWESLKERFMQPGFDPAEVLLLEESEMMKVGGVKIGEESSKAPIERLKHGDNLEIWSVETDRPGFFVLMNTHYPGWKAYLNGKPADILKAYGLFQAVAIAASGRHEITFKFHPFARDE